MHIRFNEVIIDLMLILTRILQESSLFSILYILYNSDLLNIFNKEKQLRLGFVDDILIKAQNKTVTRNARELKQLFIKAEQ